MLRDKVIRQIEKVSTRVRTRETCLTPHPNRFDLARRPLPRRALPRTPRRRIALQLRLQRRDSSFGFPQQFFQPGSAAVRAGSRRGAHPHPILGQPLQLHQPHCDQCRHPLRQQAIEQRHMRDAKIRQRRNPSVRLAWPMPQTRLPLWFRATGSSALMEVLPDMAAASAGSAGCSLTRGSLWRSLRRDTFQKRHESLKQRRCSANELAETPRRHRDPPMARQVIEKAEAFQKMNRKREGFLP